MQPILFSISPLSQPIFIYPHGFPRETNKYTRLWIHLEFLWKLHLLHFWLISKNHLTSPLLLSLQLLQQKAVVMFCLLTKDTAWKTWADTSTDTPTELWLLYYCLFLQLVATFAPWPPFLGSGHPAADELVWQNTVLLQGLFHPRATVKYSTFVHTSCTQ